MTEFILFLWCNTYGMFVNRESEIICSAFHSIFAPKSSHTNTGTRCFKSIDRFYLTKQEGERERQGFYRSFSVVLQARTLIYETTLGLQVHCITHVYLIARCLPLLCLLASCLFCQFIWRFLSSSLHSLFLFFSLHSAYINTVCS